MKNFNLNYPNWYFIPYIKFDKKEWEQHKKIRNIIKACVDFYGIDKKNIQTPDRHWSILSAKYACRYLLKNYTNLSHVEIASLTGCTHTAISKIVTNLNNPFNDFLKEISFDCRFNIKIN